MKLNTYISGGMCFLTSLVIALASYADEPQQTKDILVLNSYNQGYRWTDSEMDGIRSVFPQGRSGYELHIEYMDSKNCRTKESDELLSGLLAVKMAKKRYGGLIVVDNDALDFARQNRKTLFKDMKVVFCGINDFDLRMISDWPNCTGVAETQDYAGSCDIGLSLFPKVRKIFVISDDSLTGKAHFEGVRKIESKFPGKTFVYWNFSTHPIYETVKEVAALGPESMVLMLSFFQDSKGQTFSMEEAIHRIMSDAKAPVFVGNDSRIMYGVIGGKVLRGFDQGAMGARMMEKIVGGAPVASLPVILDSPCRFTFDYPALQKFGIEPASLPEGSIVLNRPSSFYSVDKPLFITILMILVLLVLLVVVLAINMIQKRRSGMAMKESEERFRALFEQAAVGVGLVDPEGYILKVNRKYADMLGYTQNAMEGMNFRAFAHSDDLDETISLMKKLLAGEIKDFSIERRATHKNGSTVWLLLNVSLLRLPGGRVYQIPIIQDITERKRLEEHLIRSEKLSAVGQLAAGVAHEFNNVLMVLKGNLELASLEDMNRKELSDLFTLLDKQIDRGRDIVSKIMSFARPKQPKRDKFKLKAMVYEVISLQVEQMRLENISPEMDIPDSIEICADRGHIQQVLVNLFLNARHAICPKGFGTIRVSAERYGQGVSIRVSDNGIGMSMDTRKMIFTPFFTTKGAFADNSLNIKGSGLGLSVCDNIIRMHGGQIGFESQEGVGTTFIIYIPDCKEGRKEVKGEARPDTKFSIADLKVLVVDDEPDICFPLARMLSHVGCSKPKATVSPFEALTFIQVDPPDLIFLDMMMPGISGEQILERIREDKKDISVVFISGKLDVDEDKLMKAGALGFIQKPFGKDAVMQILKQAKEKKEQSRR